MSLPSLKAISPLDGRYVAKIARLTDYFSEAALISARVKVELAYLKKLAKFKIIRPLSAPENKRLKKWLKLSDQDLLQVKKIEKATHHDVKAVEYLLRQKFESGSLKDLSSMIHFALTSEDVNNLSYRLMISGALDQVILPQLTKVLQQLAIFVTQTKKIPMLARTHGQPAIPTTLGKELSVAAARVLTLLKKLNTWQPEGKLNGAVGGYHAMIVSYPQVNWPKLSRSLVEELGCQFKDNTTQINPPDDLIELFGLLQHLNSVILDLDQDIWRYISDDWLVQKGKEKYVGSSTMPQKVNPIEFENSEGNIVVANALFEAFRSKLPVSRLQRDLSDSTVLRNIGVAFGHSLLAYQGLLKGLDKLSPNQTKIKTDLNHNWNILAEAAQVMARKQGDPQAYEKIAALTKKKVITKRDWQQLTRGMDQSIQQLTPREYLGLSVKLAEQTIRKITRFLKTNQQRKND